jgi:ElaB/YqjD/DUF883 family membrane-anchored ribosome-binding protein
MEPATEARAIDVRPSHLEDQAMTQRTSGRNNSTDDQGNPGTPTAERLASKAHDAVDRAAEAANYAEREVRNAASRTAERAQQLREQAVEAADENVQRVRSYVEQNPMMAAGIAFAAGVILSSLFRR